jgi:hypothetical protein
MLQRTDRSLHGIRRKELAMEPNPADPAELAGGMELI